MPPPVAGAPPLHVLALAPLPFLSDGQPSFHGGGTVFYAQLLRRLAQRGHDVVVFAEAPRATGATRTPLLHDVPGLRVHAFAYEHHSSHRDRDPDAVRRTRGVLTTLLEQELAARRPDVLLVGRDVVLPLVLDVCARHRVPTLLVSHGPAVAALVAGRYPAAEASALRAALAQADGIVAVACHVENDLRRLGATRAETIANAVDLELFQPAAKDEALLGELRVPPGAPVVVHLSVLRPWKRAHDVVDSAPATLRAEPRCVYVVVGDGPTRASLIERARALGVEASFRFTGEVMHDAVARHLRLGDVVVHSSEREGFPLVYREAQACGLALLASDIPAAREAIDHERTGILYPVGDVTTLAAQTVRLLRDATLRRRLGTAARAAAESCGMDAWTSAYERALRAAATRAR